MITNETNEKHSQETLHAIIDVKMLFCISVKKISSAYIEYK